MRDEHAFSTRPITELYTWFAGETEPTSATWAALCRWSAETPAVHARLDALPGRKRQPNIFLAAVRYLGGPTEPGPRFLAWFDEHWPEIERVILARSTQTNEPGRCAVFAPVLASLPQPISLLEVGASAGLTLYPDRYRYRYAGAVEAEITPPTAPADAPLLRCRVTGTPPGDPTYLVVSARAGLDVAPLDPSDPDDARWLRSLVWPGDDEREARLAEALALVGAKPPHLLRGDLTDKLDALLALAAPGTTPVVVNSATLAYLERPERDAFVARVRDAGVHWLSFEGPSVVTSLRGVLPHTDAWRSRPHFVVALDGTPLGRAHAHGRWVEWE